METNYKNVSWDTEDLIECKQAFIILYYREKVSMDIIDTLDFGNLDTDSVITESESN